MGSKLIKNESNLVNKIINSGEMGSKVVKN